MIRFINNNLVFFRQQPLPFGLKRSAWIMTLILTLLSSMGATLAGEKYKIAINDLDAFGVPESLAQGVSDLIRTELFRTGYFHVMERKQMQKILKEQTFQLSGATDDDVVSIGKMLSVQLMAMGSINKLGGAIVINLRLVDVEEARVRVAETANAGGEEGIQVALKWLANKLAESLPLKGQVIRNKNNELIISLGSIDRMQKGTVLKVQRPGELLRDPSSGKVLGRLDKEVATLKVLQVMSESLSSAKVIETQSKIKIGDVVVLGNSRAKTQMTKKNVVSSSPQPVTQVSASSKLVYTATSVGNKFGSWSGARSGNTRHIEALQSEKWLRIRQAAKEITLEREYPTEVMDLVASILLENYKLTSKDRYQVDGLAWLCRALGSSRQKRHRTVLQQVSSDANNRKVKRYASKALAQLPQ